MPTTKTTTRGVDYNICTDPLSAVSASPWYRFGPGTVTAAIGGGVTPASGPTAVTATVQRSATDPNDPVYGAQPAAASTTQLTGNPSQGGVNALALTESGIGWWRINTTALTAGGTPGATSLTGAAAN